MKPEVLEAHLVPMRAESDWGFERVVQHESLEPCHHAVLCQEVQDDLAFKKLKQFEPGQRLFVGSSKSLTAELRAARLMAPGSDWDSVTTGLARERPFRVVRVMPRKQVMPSQTGRGARSCSQKLARAEFYSAQYHRKSGGSGSHGRTQVIDQAELEKVLQSLALITSQND